MLTREELLSGKSLRSDTVEISIGEVRIREMLGNQREEFSSCFVGNDAVIPAGMQAKMVRWCLVEPSLTDCTDDEIYAHIGGRDLEVICGAILRISGMTDDGIEELRGNSKRGRKGGRGSGSRKPSAAR